VPKDEIRVDVACECTRIGYALFLCQVHAPIPYTLTDRGHRDARRHGENMKQWDAIKDSVVESEKARQLLLRGAIHAGRTIEARERRRNGVGK
jgi:hypothetical protein